MNLQIQDEILNNFSLVIQFYNSKNYIKSIGYLENILEKSPEYPNIYLKASEIFYRIMNYKRSYELAQKALELYLKKGENDLESIYFLLSCLESKLGINKKSYTNLKEKNLFDKVKINEIKKNNIEERKDEGRYLHKLLNTAKEDPNRNLPGESVFIIKKNWFDQWKKFVFYHENEKNDEITEELDEETEHPGYMDKENLIEKFEFLDPFLKEEYTNYQIKYGLIENKDFVIVSPEIFLFFASHYGAFPIKRKIVCLDEEKRINQIEIWLKKINFFIIPTIKNGMSMDFCDKLSVFVRNKDKVYDFKQKVCRIFEKDMFCNKKSIQGFCKIWKLNENFLKNYSNVIEKIKNFKENKIPLDGNILDENSMLEDCEIREEDYLLVEFKTKNTWIFIENDEEIIKNSSCATCGASDKMLLLCQCRQIKYCSEECQHKNWPTHKQTCTILKNSTKNKNLLQNIGISDKQEILSYSRKGLTGLQNLGNTCFMNSAIQCLSNVFELSKFFYSNNFVSDLNIDNPLGTACAYAELIKNLWIGQNPYIAPWGFKKSIAKLAPQFSGFSQQDSQELLNYLIDGLHEDLNRIKKKPFVETREFSEKEDSYQHSLLTWQDYKLRNDSQIVDYFAAQFKSTVTCPTCKRISIKFDPYFLISLPIPIYEKLDIGLYFIFLDSKRSPLKIEYRMLSTWNVQELIAQLSKDLLIEEKYIEAYLIKGNVIIERPDEACSIRYLDNHPGTLFICELACDKKEINKDFLRIEVVVMKNNEKISFSRVLCVDKKSSNKEIGLEIYKRFRNSLRNVIKSDVFNEEFEDFQKEYEELFINNVPPYKLYFLFKKDKETQDFEANDLNFFENIPTEEDLKMIISFSDKHEKSKLKLSTCQSARFKSPEIQSNNIQLNQCLELFSKEEILDKNNEWYCNICDKHQQAKKKIDLYSTPKYLILHLKRFKTDKIASWGRFYFPIGSSKITNLVEFPLDLSIENSNENGIVERSYELIGIVNHYGDGGIAGGHYTAYCRNEIENEWYEFDDAYVKKVSESKIVSKAAYVLFYKIKNK